MATKTRDLVDRLYEVEGKAEIVNGKVVRMSPTGHLPSRAAGEIYVHLHKYVRRTGGGYAYTDNAGFLVDLPNRQSFSPDAAFHVGEPTGMKFLEGAPVFAVEVRSEHDYGPEAERQMAEKRADYFAAGTEVVWDVDLQSEEAVVCVFRGGNFEEPAVVYSRGEEAEAEPALPGWRMAVEDLFD